MTALQNSLCVHTRLVPYAVGQSWGNMCKGFKLSMLVAPEVHPWCSVQSVMWCGVLQIRGAEPSVGSAANPGKIGEGIANNINGPDPKGAASEVCTCCCCLSSFKMSLCTTFVCQQALGCSAGQAARAWPCCVNMPAPRLTANAAYCKCFLHFQSVVIKMWQH